jgi:hypothetical protein
MSKITHVTTRQLDDFIAVINAWYQGKREITPTADKFDQVKQDRDRWVGIVHAVYKPSARPYAGQALAHVTYEMFHYYVRWLFRDISILKESVRQEQLKVDTLRWREGMWKGTQADLQSQIEDLQGQLANRPQAVAAEIPAQRAVIRSAMQQEIMRLMGAEGLGRSWRIIARVAGAGWGKENSVRNALCKLTKQGVIDDCRRQGKAVHWKFKAGGNRRLVRLTELGRVWYREAFGHDAAESEITQVARKHRSIAHGVGILEARDHLREAGYLVSDDPQVILADSGERWGPRSEPDLVATIDGVAWPVEVQREVSERLLGKWEKALALAGRLALVLFNEEHREKQAVILDRAMWFSRLAPGEIRLTSLEAMEAGDWKWHTVA